MGVELSAEIDQQTDKTRTHVQLAVECNKTVTLTLYMQRQKKSIPTCDLITEKHVLDIIITY